MRHRFLLVATIVLVGLADLRRDARRGFRRLGRRTTELHSFFRHVGLSVN